MTTPPTTAQISIRIRPFPHQAAQLISIGERLNDLRLWSYGVANGHFPADITLAELARGEPATSQTIDDEVAALQCVARFSDIPAGVLAHTIGAERAAIADERQRTGQLRELSLVWDRTEIDIAGADWCAVWTPELITLDGIQGAVDADLGASSVPARARQVWGRDRLVWCAWASGSTRATDARQLAAFKADRQRYDLAGDLGTLTEVRDAWPRMRRVAPGMVRFPWTRVQQTEVGWWLTLAVEAT